MGAALSALGMICTSLGLTKIMSFIDELKSSSKGMSAADITAIIDRMASEARSKGSSIYNRLTEKIAALPNPIIQSAAVKSIIQKRRKELSEKARTVSEGLNKVENELAPLSQQANALAYMSDSFRSSDAGKGVLKNIQDRAQTSINNVNKILEGVENNV